MQHYNFFRVPDSSRNDICDTSFPIAVNACGKTNSDIPFNTVYEDRADYHCLYVTEGGITAFMDNKPISLRAGDILFYHPHQKHHYEFKGSGKITYYWVYFTGKDVQSLLDNFGFSNQKIMNIAINDRICDLFEHLINEMVVRKKDFYLYSGTYLLQILLEISRFVFSKTNESASTLRIEKSLSFIANNIKQEISVSDLAAIENLSPSRYRYLFKECTRKSPKEYLTHIRMQQACDMLTMTTFSITDIAEKTGYKNILYFCRIFKQYTGMTASEFRKRSISKDGTSINNDP